MIAVNQNYESNDDQRMRSRNRPVRLKAAREVARRARAGFMQGRERVALERLSREPARLSAEYASLTPAGLLDHFRAER